MKLVCGHDETVAAWIEQTHGVYVIPAPRQVIGVVDDEGVLRGAFVVTWHYDTTAELHVYGKTSPNTWRSMFYLAFINWGVVRLEARTTKRNKIITKAAKKFGATYECTAKHYYGKGEHAIVFVMTAETCRWIKRNVSSDKGRQLATNDVSRHLSA